MMSSPVNYAKRPHTASKTQFLQGRVTQVGFLRHEKKIGGGKLI
jgi:hypothetical protein